MPVTAQQVELIPLAVYTLIAVVLILALLVAAYYLGSGKDAPDKGIPYESGVLPTGELAPSYGVHTFVVSYVYNFL